MLNFYLRLLKRQSRLPAMRLFALALALACGVTFCMTLLSDRVSLLLTQQSQQALGADLIFESSSPLKPEQQQLIQAYPAEHIAHTLIFRTMAQAKGDFILSSVKAVSGTYPLKGQLEISDGLYQPARTASSGPRPGEVWLEDRILNSLSLNVGEQLQIGDQTFLIRQVLVHEPDKANNFYSFIPRILMHLDDVAATGVVQPGSRVTYNVLLERDKKKPNLLNALQQALSATLEPNQKFVSLDARNQTLALTLNKAYQFLMITALLAVLLGAVGVALVSYQYAAEMTYQYAVLRCLGLRGTALRLAVILPFLSVTLVAIIIGLILGGGVHLVIVRSLAGVLSETLPAPGMTPWLLSILTALFMVLSFAWPFLIGLVRTPPKQLLMPKEIRPQKLLPATLSMTLGCLLLVYLNLQSLLLSSALVLGLVVYIGLALLLMALVFKLLQAAKVFKTPQLMLSLRLFKSNQRMNTLQIIAIALTFFSLALIQTLRDDLITSWQAKVPEQAPNYFVINVFEEEREALQQALTQRQLPASPMYPVVRGRLIKVNATDVALLAAGNQRAQSAIDRDLSLTWANALPVENRIVTGQWWASGDEPEYIQALNADDHNALPGVSIEQGLAQNLGVKLGDVLSFVIETRTLKARVSSIRKLSWESFTPNFYMMFEPGALDSFTSTYLASFYVAGDKKITLPELMRQFPSASFFDVDFLLKRIRKMIAQVSFAVEVILYFALFASLVVFVAIEMILHNSRLYNNGVLKALGATSGMITRFYRLQLLLTGLLAGLLAYGLNTIVAYITTVWVLDSHWVFNPKTVLLCLLLTPLMVYIAGLYSIYRLQKASTKTVLNESVS